MFKKIKVVKGCVPNDIVCLDFINIQILEGSVPHIFLERSFPGEAERRMGLKVDILATFIEHLTSL